MSSSRSTFRIQVSRAALPEHLARMTVANAVYKLSGGTIWDKGSSIYDEVLPGDYGWYGSVYCEEVGSWGRFIGGVGGHGFAGNGRNGFDCDTGEISVFQPNQYETADRNGAEIYLDKAAADALPEHRGSRSCPPPLARRSRGSASLS